MSYCGSPICYCEECFPRDEEEANGGGQAEEVQP